MTNPSRNRYEHIESFEDFENEKMKLYYQIKFSERKLQLKYIELGLLLSPARLIPLLVSEWVNPVVTMIKNFIAQFFGGNKHTSEEKSEA